MAVVVVAEVLLVVDKAEVAFVEKKAAAAAALSEDHTCHRAVCAHNHCVLRKRTAIQ